MGKKRESREMRERSERKKKRGKGSRIVGLAPYGTHNKAQTTSVEIMVKLLKCP